MIDWPTCRVGILALLYSSTWVYSTPDGKEAGEERNERRGFGTVKVSAAASFWRAAIGVSNRIMGS